MDLCVEAPTVSYGELTESRANEDSAAIRERVVRCNELQQQRYRDEPFSHNSRIPASRLDTYCALGEKEQRYMEQMYEKMALTARTYHKILRVARTIADLGGAAQIRLSDLQEAVCYRNLDARFWGGAV
jgi:magnesium chelatase family protein